MFAADYNFLNHNVLPDEGTQIKPDTEQTAIMERPDSSKSEQSIRLEKSNIILLGPTGCGECIC